VLEGERPALSGLAEGPAPDGERLALDPLLRNRQQQEFTAAFGMELVFHPRPEQTSGRGFQRLAAKPRRVGLTPRKSENVGTRGAFPPT